MDGRVLVWDTSRLVPVTEFKVGERAYMASMPSLAAVGSSHCLIAVTEMTPENPSFPRLHFLIRLQIRHFNPPPNPPLLLRSAVLYDAMRCNAMRCDAV